MKKVFLTFANTAYMSTDRIAKQVKELELFDEIRQLSEKDIPEFINEHKAFIEANTHGYGKWIWKPKIIYDTLLDVNDNDIIFYSDAGTYINIKGKERMIEYLDMLLPSDSHILTFGTSEAYNPKLFVCIDAVMEYYPDFIKESNITCYAGIMIIKKTSKTISLIKEWLDLCTNYKYLAGVLSGKYPNLPGYVGNDCDNGLFNLCLAKHKISKNIFPDECNVYTPDKRQAIHSSIHINQTDWSVLDDKPIQIRRMTPKFGF
jgi:hypothetical protein